MLHQRDLKNAFMHAKFQEEVYMDKPLGNEVIVSKPCKALYGLKQAPRAWYDQIVEYFFTIGSYMENANY